MVSYATLILSYDPDGQFIFPLTVWVTELRLQNSAGIDFCRQQFSGIHFHQPGMEIKNSPKSMFYGRFHQNKPYHQVSAIFTIRNPYTKFLDHKSARCWKYSTADTHKHFPLGSKSFQPNQNAVATGFSLINTLCTRSEQSLPILLENNNNHQIILPKGRS